MPFLKAKQNEIRALAKIAKEDYSKLIPFLDIPRAQEGTSEAAKEKIDVAKKNLSRAYDSVKFAFYIDVFDIPYDVAIDGEHPYEYLLKQFSEFNFIPVLGLDREEAHINAVLSHCADADYVAIRLVDDDLKSFNLIKSALAELMAKFGEDTVFDIVLDNRLVLEAEVPTVIKDCLKMIRDLKTIDKVDEIIVTGSSIPPIITELVSPQSKDFFTRHEWEVWSNVVLEEPDQTVFGDYTVVSPGYSDVNLPVALMRTTQTPRVIYSELSEGFITRGGALKTHGDSQYYKLAVEVVHCGFFRSNFSRSDIYIENVSNRLEKKKIKGGVEVPICGSPSKWIEITVGSHIAFMLSSL